jgi:hypothetical protein
MHLLNVLRNIDKKEFLRARNRPWSLFFLVSFYFILNISFSLVTPAFSGPDDDFHVTSTWCAKGVEMPNCISITPGEYWSMSTVPGDLKALRSCKSRDISASRLCEIEGNRDQAGEIRSNNGSYPSLFYEINNLFVGPDARDSLIKIRVFNSAILTFMLLMALALVPYRKRWALLAITIFTTVPFPLFMLGTNNPQSWSLALIVPFFTVFNLNIIQTEIKFLKVRPILSAFYLVVAGSMILGSRADGKFLIIYAIGITFLLNARRINVKNIFSFISALVVTGILDKIFGAATPDFTKSRMDSDNPGYFLHNILEFPGFILGLIGGKGDSGYLSFGEFDLPVPSIVWVSIFLALIMATSGNTRSKGMYGVLLVGSLLIAFIGLYSMHLQGASTAGYFQPRYLLGFVLILLSTALMENFEKITNLRLLIALFLLFIGFIGFVYSVILRYSSGVLVEKSKYLEMYSGPNTYVSKETVHWRMFQGDIYGLVTLNSGLCFSFFTLIWAGILSSLYISKKHFDKIL